jgi:hypothetical protein
LRAIARAARQKAVYWGNPQNDGTGGKTFDAPVELDVRWEQRQDLFTDAAGLEIRSRAVVYSLQDLTLDAVLYLGELDDLTAEEQVDPQIVADAFPVRAVEKVPGLRARSYTRRVWL